MHENGPRDRMSHLAQFSLVMRRIHPGGRRFGPVPVFILLPIAAVFLLVVLGEWLRWGGAVSVCWWADGGRTLSGGLATAACLSTACRQ